MLEKKKREALSTTVENAQLAAYGTTIWSGEHRTRAIGLIRDALLRGNSPAAMVFTLFHYKVLFSIPDLKDYDFKGNYSPLEFVDNAIAAQSLTQRCELFTLMCEISAEDHIRDVRRRRIGLTQQFLYKRIVDEFPDGSEGGCLASVLDDSLRNLRSETGHYGHLGEFRALAQILERLAVGV